MSKLRVLRQLGVFGTVDQLQLVIFPGSMQMALSLAGAPR